MPRPRATSTTVDGSGTGSPPSKEIAYEVEFSALAAMRSFRLLLGLNVPAIVSDGAMMSLVTHRDPLVTPLAEVAI